MNKLKKKVTVAKPYRRFTNRGHRLDTQWTKPGEPMNNHQPRLGTKRPASAGGCKCEDCMAGRQPIVEKVLEREAKEEIAKVFAKEEI